MKFPLRTAQAARHPLLFIQRRAWFAALGIVVLWMLQMLCPRPALADGIYMPEKAFQKIPEISAQRALIKWKDGEETLVIASALDSESQRLGWIIPLPSVPSEISKADPGGLKTLSFCVQPEITTESTVKAVTISIVVTILIFLVSLRLFAPRYFGWALFLLCLLLILASMSIPCAMSIIGRTYPVAASVLPVEKTAQVGAYEVVTLQAKTSTELNDWLDRNGFISFPSSAEPVLANYIQRNWVFVAIKLARTEKGANTPAPVKLVFKSPEAIYPLQLTALAGTTPAFELFVLGDSQAGFDLLKTEFCQRYQEEWAKNSLTEYFKPYFNHYLPGNPEYYSYFSIGGQKFGHPSLTGLFWGGCVLTKLSGTIASTRMKDDLRLRWSEFQPCREHLYTTSGALWAAVIPSVLLFGTLVIVTLNASAGQIRRPFGFLSYLGKRIFPSIAICAMIWGGVFLMLPKIKGELVSTRIDMGRNCHFENGFVRHGQSIIFDIYRLTPYGAFEESEQKSEGEIAGAVLEALRDPHGELQRNRFYRFSDPLPSKPENPLYGGEITLESTPGNLTVTKEGNKVIVTMYDQIGLPFRLEYMAVPWRSR